MAFQAGASTKRNNRHLVSRTEFDDLAHLLSRLHECDGVRWPAGVIRGIPAMFLAHVRSRRQAIAQQLTQGSNGGVARGSSNGFNSSRRSHSDSFWAFFRSMTLVLDILLHHLVSDVIRLPNCERHNR